MNLENELAKKEALEKAEREKINTWYSGDYKKSR